jgi:hypothetical protein
VAAGKGGGSAADDLRGRWEGVRRSGRWTKQRRRPEEERRHDEFTGRRSGGTDGVDGRCRRRSGGTARR